MPPDFQLIVMKYGLKKKFCYSGVACIVLIASMLYYFFFTSFSKLGSTQYVYIDADDNVDSVCHKLRPWAHGHSMNAFTTLIRHGNYEENIRTGRYAIEPGRGALTVFRHLKNGMQAPVRLTIPPIRTKDRLAAVMSEKLMMDSLSLLKALNNQDVCRKLGYDTATVICMFIPNTYEVYWNIPIESFFERMKTECNRFWTEERQRRADAMGLSREEVVTLASIVDEETADDKEKPMIAGMYYNRLKLRSNQYPKGMPLQADPTVKFAWKRFEVKRIYLNMLLIDSPYNTYRYAGLPPGPIRIPTVAGIDAVLNHVQHDYLYMRAKEDFSGTHNFARTFAEHQENAKRYAIALNRRGIK